jgi:hydroxymethylbilane synthase
MAGITRLGIEDPMISPVETKDFLPACGQGIICMEIHESNEQAHQILEAVNHVPTSLCAVAEREVLRVLDGSCHTPIAAYATMDGNQLTLQAFVASLDGQTSFEEVLTLSCQTISEAREIGLTVGGKIKAQLPKGFLE